MNFSGAYTKKKGLTRFELNLSCKEQIRMSLDVPPYHFVLNAVIRSLGDSVPSYIVLSRGISRRHCPFWDYTPRTSCCYTEGSIPSYSSFQQVLHLAMHHRRCDNNPPSYAATIIPIGLVPKRETSNRRTQGSGGKPCVLCIDFL